MEIAVVMSELGSDAHKIFSKRKKKLLKFYSESKRDSFNLSKCIKIFINLAPIFLLKFNFDILIVVKNFTLSSNYILPH